MARGQDPGTLSESEVAEVKRPRNENAELKTDHKMADPIEGLRFFAKETNR